ncbi:hypothetical protein CHCC14821_3664 [Bacillus paralicheniformis]|nr:hypothetical protein CHCC14821_3664 [Bacillus paralicheniformis]
MRGFVDTLKTKRNGGVFSNTAADFNDRQIGRRAGWMRVKPVLSWKTVPALNC